MFLEHLSDPLNQAILINKALKKNGDCILCISNINSYFFKIDISTHPYFDYPAHLNYFSIKSIEYLMYKAGFKDIKILYTTFSWEKTYITENFYKKGLVNKKGWHLLDDWNKTGNGEHLICICRK